MRRHRYWLGRLWRWAVLVLTLALIGYAIYTPDVQAAPVSTGSLNA